MMLSRWLLAAACAFPGTAALAEPAGARLFADRCVACHQAGGVGVPGIAPPLAGNVGRMAATEAGREYLARVLLVGLVGPIHVDGVRYTGNMPSQAALGDAELAEVLGYVLRDLEQVADLSWLTVDYVGKLRRAGGTPNEMHKLRAKLPAAGK